MTTAYTVPYYIGYPGAQSFDDQIYNSGGNYVDFFREDMEKRFQIAHIQPRNIHPSAAANIFKGEECWDDFVRAIESNGIVINDDNKELRVVCRNLTTVSETYNNEFGQSDLLSGVQNLGSKYSELAFAFGINDMDKAIEQLAGQEGLLGNIGKVADAGNKLIQAGIDKTGPAKNLLTTAFRTLKNPNNKIDFPLFWKSSGYNAQYELQTRLYCYNVQDDAYYTSYILAAYCALMQFVLPRSEDGELYSWPFLMDLRIPGMLHLPLCYCSNISVIKGGENNDLSYAYRPNIIDINMTINPLYNVMYNIINPDNNNPNIDSRKERPTLLKELDVLSQKRTFTDDGVSVDVEVENAVSTHVENAVQRESLVAYDSSNSRTSVAEKYAEHSNAMKVAEGSTSSSDSGVFINSSATDVSDDVF